jgi:hypothetical protein
MRKYVPYRYIYFLVNLASHCCVYSHKTLEFVNIPRDIFAYVTKKIYIIPVLRSISNIHMY